MYEVVVVTERRATDPGGIDARSGKTKSVSPELLAWSAQAKPGSGLVLALSDIIERCVTDPVAGTRPTDKNPHSRWIQHPQLSR